MLTWTSAEYGVAIAVTFDRYDMDRVQYTWTIAADEHHVWTGDDLRSGSGAEYDPTDMLRTLCTFLGAWTESVDRENGGHIGENADLFPADMLRVVDVSTWSAIADEMSMELRAYDYA